MLKQRVITATFLLSLVSGLILFAPPNIFIGFVGLVLGVGAWEWANLSGLTKGWQRVSYAILLLATGLIGFWLFSGNDQSLVKPVNILMVSGVWWAIALLWVQGYPSSQVLWQATWTRAAIGFLGLLPTLLGVSLLRHMNGGTVLIFAVVLIVAAADTGAYFSGKAFGRRKLAPRVSPGKSWEGVIGGLLTVVLISVAFHLVHPSTEILTALAIALPTAAVSVVGDLLESMFKRHRGVKDSSQLLPGHGGVLDRIDGLVAAVPVFTLCVLSTGWSW